MTDLAGSNQLQYSTNSERETSYTYDVIIRLCKVGSYWPPAAPPKKIPADWIRTPVLQTRCPGCYLRLVNSQGKIPPRSMSVFVAHFSAKA